MPTVRVGNSVGSGLSSRGTPIGCRRSGGRRSGTTRSEETRLRGRRSPRRRPWPRCAIGYRSGPVGPPMPQTHARSRRSVNRVCAHCRRARRGQDGRIEPGRHSRLAEGRRDVVAMHVRPSPPQQLTISGDLDEWPRLVTVAPQCPAHDLDTTGRVPDRVDGANGPYPAVD